MLRAREEKQKETRQRILKKERKGRGGRKGGKEGRKERRKIKLKESNSSDKQYGGE